MTLDESQQFGSLVKRAAFLVSHLRMLSDRTGDEQSDEDLVDVRTLLAKAEKDARDLTQDVHRRWVLRPQESRPTVTPSQRAETAGVPVERFAMNGRPAGDHATPGLSSGIWRNSHREQRRRDSEARTWDAVVDVHDRLRRQGSGK